MSGSLFAIRSNTNVALSDEDILRTLMKSRDRIAAAVWIVVRDAQAAEDIFQNVALKAMTGQASFPAAGAVLSWAFITARREGIDWLRHRQHESPALDGEILELLEHEWLSEAAAGDYPPTEALRECLDKMPERSRHLLRLRYFDGYACKEVAKNLDMGLGAIYKRLSRLHQALKECVEQRLRAVEESAGS